MVTASYYGALFETEETLYWVGSERTMGPDLFFYTFFVEFYNFGSGKFYKKIVEFLWRVIFSTISVKIVEIL